MYKDITPIILTYNEEENIERTLSKLSWAERIVVVDSFSNDQTIKILKNHSNVEICQRVFDSHEKQWNFALEQVRTKWVLSLDADYLVSDELVKEIGLISDNKEEEGFWVELKFCVDEVPLKCSVLPPRIVLFQKSKATYYQNGHTQTLKLDGKVGYLKGYIYHDDRKSFKEWLCSQEKYSDLEIEKLFQTDYNKLKIADKIRKLVMLLPLVIPVYILLFKGGIFDGRRGIYYAYLRTYYEAMLSFKVLKRYNTLLWNKFKIKK